MTEMNAHCHLTKTGNVNRLLSCLDDADDDVGRMSKNTTCVGPVLVPEVGNSAEFGMTEGRELGQRGQELPEGPILHPRSFQIQLIVRPRAPSTRADIAALCN